MNASKKRKPAAVNFTELSTAAAAGASHDLIVKVAKNDLAYSWKIFLEGIAYTPGDFDYQNGVWVKQLPGFQISGPLDVVLEADGTDNGVQRGRVAARISRDGTVLTPDLVVETIKGHGVATQSYA